MIKSIFVLTGFLLFQGGAAYAEILCQREAVIEAYIQVQKRLFENLDVASLSQVESRLKLESATEIDRTHKSPWRDEADINLSIKDLATDKLYELRVRTKEASERCRAIEYSWLN